MAETQPCPGTLQVDMKYVRDAQEVRNVFHIFKETADHWDVPMINAVLDYFEDTFWPAVKTLLPADISLMEFVGTDLTDLDGYRVVRPISPAQPGTGADPGCPNNISLAVRLGAQNRGRGVNGRFFIPALMESQVTGNRVEAGTVAAWCAALGAIITGIQALDGSPDWVVLSRYLNGAKRVAGFVRPILNVACSDLYVDSQKLRLPFHKKHKKETPSTP